jgi:CHAD domain-containing protein
MRWAAISSNPFIRSAGNPKLPSLILELIGGDTMAFDLDRVQKDIRELRKFLKRGLKHRTPQEIHSLRTQLRRFEASMQVLALDSNPNERRLLRKMAKLRRRAGKVRDLDVLTGYAVGVKMIGEDDCQVQLLESLGAEHAQRNQRLHSFAVRHGESLRRRLKCTASHLKTLSAGSLIDDTAPGYTMLLELRLQRELTAKTRLTRNNLHPYRLKVKELRFMLQMENHPSDRQLIETLGEMKDAMGEWHDWQQLLTIAREQLSHGSKCKLLPLFQATTNQKLKRALAVANRGRKQIQPALAGTEDNA